LRCRRGRLFFYLDLILDVFSRKIVGWEIHTEQTSDHAAVLFRQAHLREGVAANTLVLHSDNGSPMKGATLLVTLQRLGVVPSFRPAARQYMTTVFGGAIQDLQVPPRLPRTGPSRAGNRPVPGGPGFVRWYNERRAPGTAGIRFVTPARERHRGDDVGSWNSARHSTKLPVKPLPERWSGTIRNWERPAAPVLSPQAAKQTSPLTQGAGRVSKDRLKKRTSF